MIIVVIPKNALTEAPDPIVKVMEPHNIGQDHDDAGCVDHRCIAEKTLATEGRDHFGKNTESWQNKNIDFRVTPYPDEVDIHHRITTKIVGEEIRSHIAVQRKKGERGGKDRERRHNEHVGAQ